MDIRKKYMYIMNVTSYYASRRRTKEQATSLGACTCICTLYILHVCRYHECNIAKVVMKRESLVRRGVDIDVQY